MFLFCSNRRIINVSMMMMMMMMMMISGMSLYESNDPTNSVKALKEDRVL